MFHNVKLLFLEKLQGNIQGILKGLNGRLRAYPSCSTCG